MNTFRLASTIARRFAAALAVIPILGAPAAASADGSATALPAGRHLVTPVSRLNLETYAKFRSAEPLAATPAETPRVVFGLPRPNPTRGLAEVPVTLAAPAEVRASLFDARGRLVRELPRGVLFPGEQLVRWDGRTESGVAAASGVYWLRVEAGAKVATVRLVITR